MLTLSLTNKTKRELPDKLLLALERAQHRLRYTAVVDLFYAVWLWGDEMVGVFGDGDNGAYEWFRWRDGGPSSPPAKLETSDCGYGSPHVALRDVLNLADPAEPEKSPHVGL